MHSESTTKSVPTELHHDLADITTPAKQRRRRKAQGPHPVAHEAGECCDNRMSRHQPRGGAEARTIDKVGIEDVLSRWL